MYGDGLERIVGAPCARPASTASGSPPRWRDDPLVAALLLIHDLHPVPLRGPGAARRSSASARTWSPTAATSSCSRSRTASRGSQPAGQLLGLLGLGGDARAGDQAGARGRPRPTSRASRSRASRRPRRAVRALPLAGDGPAATGVELPIMIVRPRHRYRRAPDRSLLGAGGSLDLVPAGGIVATAVAGLRARGRERRRHAAGVPRTAARAAAARSRTGELDAGTLACPHCGASFFLPRAGRSLDDERLQLEPVPLLREQGHVKVALMTAVNQRPPAARSTTRSRPDSRALLVGGLRGLRRDQPAPGVPAPGAAAPPSMRLRHPPAARSAAISAGRPSPDDHRHLLNLAERRIECVV